MVTGIGLRTVVGSAVETTYGSAEPIDRRYEFVSESLQRQNTILQSEGISGRAQTVRAGGRRVRSAQMGSGDLTMEVLPVGFSRWIEHMLGGTPTISQPDDVGAPSVFLHTHELGALSGKSLTVQKVIRSGEGTVIDAFTYQGCKVTGWQLNVTVDQILRLQASLDAQQVVDDVDPAALIALSEPDLTVQPFNFLGAAITFDGDPAVRVLDATVVGANSLKTDSFFLGSNGLKAEPEVNAFREVTGTLSAEATETTYGSPAQTLHQLFADDVAVALVLSFAGQVIEGTLSEELTVTIPDIRFTGETPQVGGPDVVSQSLAFEGQYDGTNAPVTVEYQTVDSAV